MKSPMDEISEWDFLGVNELTKKLNFMQLSQGLQAQSMGKIFFFDGLLPSKEVDVWQREAERRNSIPR